MTTNKPEVFKFHCHGQFAPAYACNKPGDNSGEYVSLSDYKALAEECEKLRTAMAEAKSHIEHYMYGGSSYCRPAEEAIAIIDAVMQGGQP